MRRTALALLVAASGCNWAFGLEPTKLRDGGGDDSPDAPDPIQDHLLFGFVATDTMTGGPAAPQFKPIGSEPLRAEPPTVMVGEPLGGMPLTPATYSAVDGAFDIPYTLREAPHRIVYRLPGEQIDHEVQWSVSGATLVVPRMARFNAPAVPPGAGYKITPTGIGGASPTPAIATTGVFTFDSRSNKFTIQGTSTTYDFSANASYLTAPAVAPEGSLNDFVILADWGARDQGQQRSFVGYAITHIDLTGPASMPASAPPWITGDRTLTTINCGADCIPDVNAFGGKTRLDSIAAGQGVYALTYGVSPTTELPGFVPGSAPDFIDRPAIIPLAVSSAIDSTLLVADPTKAPATLPFERVFHVRISSKRTVGTIDLLNSLQAITNNFTDQLQFKAPLATQVQLGTTALSTDTTMVPASSQPAKLTWTDEGSSPTTGQIADDYVVTLFDITGGSLSPLRIYHVLTPSVLVDSSLLHAGSKYVFSITARTGLPMARQGSYGAGAVTFPFCETTTFPGVFTVQ